MYYQLAHLYDWSGALDFSEKILARVRSQLAATGIQPPARIVDLACGTGTLALALATDGYQVIGSDLSAAMIALAQQKAGARSAENPVWVVEDMCHFVTDAPVDAVLCHYDSLNHLSNETELRATFIQVAQALRPGGLFMFDVNTLENYQTFWEGTDSDEGPNYRLKTKAHFNEQLGQAEVLFEVQEYNDEGELFFLEETVKEQYFNEVAIEKYLMAAGFTAIQSEPFTPVDTLPDDVHLKTLWHCTLTH